MLEIELKARPEDFKACKKRLDAGAGRGTAFVKDDAYWSVRGLFVRVRREERGGGRRTLVTWKTKQRRDGVEINDEKEFAVSDPELFEELLALLGFEKRTVKRKEGWAWKAGEIAAELCEVSGSRPGGAPVTLGWFLELETAAEDRDETAARNALFCLLEKAGLAKDRVESRYYAEMIQSPR